MSLQVLALRLLIKSEQFRNSWELKKEDTIGELNFSEKKILKGKDSVRLIMSIVDYRIERYHKRRSNILLF